VHGDHHPAAGEKNMEATAHLREALVRIQTEYIEMPDLKLTARQAQRLWNLSGDVCEAALAVLTRTRFLGVTQGGAYVRLTMLRGRIEPIDFLRQAS
jgi:hypothetical protein